MGHNQSIDEIIISVGSVYETLVDVKFEWNPGTKSYTLAICDPPDPRRHTGCPSGASYVTGLCKRDPDDFDILINLPVKFGVIKIVEDIPSGHTKGEQVIYINILSAITLNSMVICHDTTIVTWRLCRSAIPVTKSILVDSSQIKSRYFRRLLSADGKSLDLRKINSYDVRLGGQCYNYLSDPDKIRMISAVQREVTDGCRSITPVQYLYRSVFDPN